MLCPDSLRVQAYFDGEADAITAADIERHMEHCDECHTLHRSLEQLRTALRRDLPKMLRALRSRAEATPDRKPG